MFIIFSAIIFIATSTQSLPLTKTTIFYKRVLTSVLQQSPLFAHIFITTVVVLLQSPYFLKGFTSALTKPWELRNPLAHWRYL